MNKSDITRDYCMLKGPLSKKGTTGGGIPSPPNMQRPGRRKPFTSNIFCATLLWPKRSRSWSGTTRRAKKRANAPPTAW